MSDWLVRLGQETVGLIVLGVSIVVVLFVVLFVVGYVYHFLTGAYIHVPF